jgi:hypothetical protein
MSFRSSWGMLTINLAYCLFKITEDHALQNYWVGRSLSLEYFLAIRIGLCWFLGQGVCYTIGFTTLGGWFCRAKNGGAKRV